MRPAILVVTVVFLAAFLGATIFAALDRGFTILSALSLLILVLMGVGIVGAMLHDPGDGD